MWPSGGWKTVCMRLPFLTISWRAQNICTSDSFSPSPLILSYQFCKFFVHSWFYSLTCATSVGQVGTIFLALTWEFVSKRCKSQQEVHHIFCFLCHTACNVLGKDHSISLDHRVKTTCDSTQLTHDEHEMWARYNPSSVKPLRWASEKIQELCLQQTELDVLWREVLRFQVITHIIG